MGHGAGAGVETLDLQALVALTAHGWCLALLEQPWRVAGRRIAVAPRLLDEATSTMLATLDREADRLPRPWVLGGRSAGARVACRLAEPAQAQALLLIAFPLQPPPSRGGRVAPSRIHELLLPVRAGIPALVAQGTRDRFGGPDEVVRAVAQENAGDARSSADGPLPVVRSYPGGHGPTEDGAGLVRDVLTFLDALP
ncbi:MAG: alpha/beta family hydrolase [Ornithinimicrobium sp.]